MASRRALLLAAFVVAAIATGNSLSASAQTDPSPTPTAAPGMLAMVLAPATYPPYGTTLVPGCQWATWIANCSNLTVYSNGGSFSNAACGPPNGCTYGPEFQCTELAQRYAAYAWGEPNNWYGYGGNDGSAASMWQSGPALPHPLMQLPNGSAPPKRGDLMVFAPGWVGSYWDPNGHVAVVSGVGSTYVDIVEENGSATGTNEFALNGATVAQPDGYTPLIGWLRPQSWAGPVDLTSQWGSGTATNSPSLLINGTQQLMFWRGTDSHLWEAWLTPGAGAWAGPVDYTAQLGGTGLLASSPSAVLTPQGQQLVFWQGTTNHLFEAWFTPNVGWSGPVDFTTQLGGAGLLGSAPSVILTPQGQQLVFWQGTNGHLFEAWFTPNVGWSGPVDFTAQLGGNGLLGSAPNVVLTPQGQQLVFWQGSSNGHLWEAWFTPNVGWSGPVDYTVQLGGTGLLASAPNVSLTPQGQQLAFWRGTENHLWEAWFTPNYGWSGPVDYTALLGGIGPLASGPVVAVTPGGQQQVFWQGTDSHLWEAWFTPGLGWSGPQDRSARTLQAPTAANLSSAPTVLQNGATALIAWVSAANHLWEAVDG